ncbi:hypothetical protein M378DRAFT_172600 [Amanita muscaria Koide BX008]|uniref:Uncharacterized protein n=1 Tax=Amanita muscaria (strain Koide BX008) TaxID=946122 RepID=A0A0C2WIT4_AMAMK|nr:hypothetical protein M378DRAFT_172600 [Amanita muscaria Koide BX008]
MLKTSEKRGRQTVDDLGQKSFARQEAKPSDLEEVQCRAGGVLGEEGAPSNQIRRPLSVIRFARINSENFQDRDYLAQGGVLKANRAPSLRERRKPPIEGKGHEQSDEAAAI